MEDSLLFTILTYSSSIITIISGIVTIFEKARIVQQVRERKWLYAIVLILICFSVTFSFYFLVNSKSLNIILTFLLGLSFVVGIGILFWYIHNAIKSLDREQENILPPKILWQMLLNKVPSIIPTEENDSGELFAVVSMDNSETVINAENKIKDSYQNGIVYVEGYNDKEEFDLTELNQKKDIRAVLFLVGSNAASKSKSLKEILSEYANSHKVNPIACYWSPEKGEYEYDLPYYRITFENLNKLIKRLATRAYYRNYMQIRLGRAYQKTFIVQGILLLLLFVGFICLGPKANKEYREKSHLIQQLNQNIKDSNLEISKLNNKTQELKDSSINLRPKPLKNDIEVRLSDKFKIRYLDSETKDALIKFSKYYFSDLIDHEKIKLWYSDDDLICVFDTENPEGTGDSEATRNETNRYRIKKIDRENYMLHTVLSHKLFVLWPGEYNIKSNIDSTAIVWCNYRNADDTNDNVKGCIYREDSVYYWKGTIKNRDITIPWHSDEDDGDKTMLLCSCNENLALEVYINFKSYERNYNYMSHLMFRNSVRKYMNIVTHILNLSVSKNASNKISKTPPTE